MTGTRHIPCAVVQARALEVAGARVIWLLGEQSGSAPDIDTGLRVLQAMEAVRLTSLCTRFALSETERDLLLLAAAPDLGPDVAVALANHPLALRGRATPGLAELVVGPGAMALLGPGSLLRHAELVTMHDGPGLRQRIIEVPETVLHYLHGSAQPDSRLACALIPLEPIGNALPELVAGLRTAMGLEKPPVIRLDTEDSLHAERIGAAALAALGLRAFALDESALELPPHRAAALLNRDLVLLDAGLIARSGPVSTALTGPVIIWGAVSQSRRPVATFPLPALRSHAPEGLRITTTELCNSRAAHALGFSSSVWTDARANAARALDGLAHRIEPKAVWEDLVLPEAQLAQLHQLAAFRQHRRRVLDDWGFRARSDRGLGLAALFSGPSGTGKTMAAEIVARDLGDDEGALALYRVDLSAIVSKYIGETEKNIARIFDAAEGSGVVLIFDEGEALFAKRTSDVKDSLDRHANTETAFLLQRLESYSGCAIVTTNLKGSVDDAFLRRFRMVVDFPFPKAEQRAAIWARVFPPETPIDTLDVAALGRLSLSGGFIRSVALSAAFLAASDGGKVTMALLERAIRQEYGKLGKPMSDGALRGLK